MKKTTVHLHTRLQISPVDPRIFGGFLEHLGRAVYEGVYDPGSARADENGYRKDVLEALDRLDMTIMRYPGGNFVSGYHWEDGIGPREFRPRVRELAWQSIETNHFGTDEYIHLCRKMGWEPMMAVNLGTGTPEEARNWVEYCNIPSGSRYADLRVTNGHPAPHDVKLWCLGNEMDGPWQLGHVPAQDYAIRAQQAAKMMKDTDRSIRCVVCGSSGIQMDTYLEWDRQVLEYIGGLADYISLHRYVGNPNDDTPDFLAVTASIDHQIEQTDAVCRYVQARRKSKKRTYLCFDEWNIWYKDRAGDGMGKVAPHLIEEVYNLEDALVAAGFLQSFIRHADVVKIANLAQIVNVIAPLQTRGDDLLIQSTFYPFEMMCKRREGISLRLGVDGPSYEGKTNGTVCTVDACAIIHEDTLHLFLTNRHMDEAAEVSIAPADTGIVSVESAELLTGPDAKAANSFEDKNVVKPVTFEELTLKAGNAHMRLPALSFAAMTFKLG
ncbi:MAG: alpha-N-arabinofuranosidase [Deltaproteobacteria bacterium]|nr:alpha-N-arabinofuranosidase [Deltaproteobacteria bacterium]